ncbi:50S ribosome-binding GTPase [Skermanella rosea]|uniref:GTPase n=1 Tax=Skermanella rosea TaxID=1817965 RepID=UPI00193204E9|nr:GTPase [Skermanella rosea]UEM02591.1 50S ribosome-binding GTPase [Skermanella rosea]
MSETSHITESLWAHLATFPATREAVLEHLNRWNAFAATDVLRVIIFGVYDAGKSSLLKRLLVEAGVPVPSWLTVSARRETFEALEIEAGNLIFVDSPGLKGGNDRHDDISRKALQLADAYLWVMPPQLVTSGQAEILGFLKGDFFHCKLPHEAVVGATIAVIGRMDEAGVDPPDSPEGYRSIVATKTAEFEAMLRKAGIEGGLVGPLCVAADPYQSVGNLPDPELGLYDPGREWDGIDALQTALGRLGGDFLRLRAWAGLRFVAAVAKELAGELAEHRSAMDLQAERFVREEERYRLFRKRLSVLIAQAEKDLQRRVEEALLSITRIGSEDTGKAIDRLEKAMKQGIDQWSAFSVAELTGLAQEFELELHEHPLEIDLSAIGDVSDGRIGTSPSMWQKDGLNKLRSCVFGFGPVLKESFHAYVGASIGMSVKTASDRLQKLEGLEGDALTAAIKKLFRTTERMEEASKYVRWSELAAVLGPIAAQLAGLGMDLVADLMTAQEAAERKRRRDELIGELAELSAKIVDQANSIFKVICDDLDAPLTEQMELALCKRMHLLEQRKKIDLFLIELNNRLDQMSARRKTAGA